MSDGQIVAVLITFILIAAAFLVSGWFLVPAAIWVGIGLVAVLSDV